MVSIANSPPPITVQATALRSVAEVKLARSAVNVSGWGASGWIHESVGQSAPFGLSAVSFGALIDLQAGSTSVTSGDGTATLQTSEVSAESWTYETNGNAGVVRLGNGASICATKCGVIEVGDTDGTMYDIYGLGEVLTQPKGQPAIQSRLDFSQPIRLADGTELSFGTTKALFNVDGASQPLDGIESLTLTRDGKSLTIENFGPLANKDGSARPMSIHSGGRSAEAIAASDAAEAKLGLRAPEAVRGADQGQPSLAASLLQQIVAAYERTAALDNHSSGRSKPAAGDPDARRMDIATSGPKDIATSGKTIADDLAAAQEQRKKHRRHPEEMPPVPPLIVTEGVPEQTGETEASLA